MDKYQESMQRKFKGFNSIGVRDGGLVVVAIKIGYNIQPLEFASVAAMKEDELGAWLITKMDRDARGKLGL